MKPNVGQIWKVTFDNGMSREYYIVLDIYLDIYDNGLYTTMQIGTGHIQTYRYIEWTNDIWELVGEHNA